MFNKRMIYFAPNEASPEGEQKGPDAAKAKMAEFFQPGPDELDDKNKPKVEQTKDPISKDEIAKWSKGYPEVSPTGENKAIVDKMKAEFVAKNEKEGRGGAQMMHRDTITWSEGNKPPQYVLVYDGLHKPAERLFKEKLADPVDSLLSEIYSKGKPTELPKTDKMVAEVKKAADPLPNKDGQYWESSASGGVKYALVYDSRKSDPLRIFKGQA
ncbi:hypothetical protein IT411_00080 [Candidatus Peregrinibacteria bacterium]|nr:hypothetical protein [Candidatus Peregrinibacteria bacterium]